ncbi:carboxy terminal-processing peptidase [Kiritimatiella glycovorans]|uniref:Tail-specific protease n=1 Tax=Kiritimatiella glycovorans TaxID=1307763 RepID=A0A0G3EC81_9BACT|nr:carboxy terminal-processing peptidase [Kiritimatiella glycovorans]AKJ64116.1 Tail-specific protease precursor [Kiritimatiella glycovorans]
MIKRLLFLCWCALAALTATAEDRSGDTPFDSRPIAKQLARRLPKMHLLDQPLNDEIATNALTIFLDSLDYNHSYFMRSDVESFRAEADRLDDRLKKGDTSFAREVFSVFMSRVSNRVDHVTALLNEGFRLDREEIYDWKRDRAPWPEDREAWDELWRKRVKNEYVARRVSLELDREATNRTDAAGSGPPGSGEGDTGSADRDLEEQLESPEAFIRDSYQQYLTVLRDYDEEWLVERYLNAFARAYDPHSNYMSPSTVEDFNISMRLSLVGIGAVLRSEDGAAKIVRIIPGGPADRDGRLQPGDKIIAVGQGDEQPQSVLHWPLNKTVQLIRGEKDTTVVLRVIPAARARGGRTETIALVRDKVKLEEQAAKGEVREVDLRGGTYRVGLATLPDFYLDMEAARENPEKARRSSRDMRRILNDLIEKGAEGLVLDLRSNGGGSLQEAIHITGQFINAGPVVQIRERRWGVQVLSDTDTGRLYSGPLVVLVNRLSASASEILAGALQDYGRAIIVGDRRTHGKGTVQTIVPLDQNRDELGKIKVTTASFFRINGSSTQVRGVESDIVLPSVLQYMDIGENELPHALGWSRIGHAFYRPTRYWRDMLPELLRNSETRQEDNPSFRTYLDQLDESRAMLEEGTVSLNLEARLERAREERDIDDLRAEAVQSPLEEEEGEEKDDPVLDETLNIMADMIRMDRDNVARSGDREPGA